MMARILIFCSHGLPPQSEYINSEDNLAFLSDIVPQRVPYHEVPGFKEKEESTSTKESGSVITATTQDTTPGTTDSNVTNMSKLEQ